MNINLPDTSILILVALVVLLSIFFGLFFVIAHAVRLSQALVSFLKHERNKDAEKIRQNAINRAEKIIEEAKARSISTLNEASAKAQKIIEDTQGISGQVQDDLNKQLHEVTNTNILKLDTLSHDIMSDFKNEMERQSAAGLDTIKEVNQALSNELNAEVASYKKALEDETINIEKAVEEKVKAKYDEVEKEINSYKLEKLQEVEREINKLVYRVAKEALSVSLNIEDNEKYVLEALEREKALFLSPQQRS